MLSLFSIPKPFQGRTRIIQANAIQSWVSLRPECEIILLGTEEGTADIASKLGTRYIPEVERNEYGTPLVGSVFEIAQSASNHHLVAYINADIIMLSDFLEVVSQIQREVFLLIGRRRDLDLKEPIDFSNPDWERQLRNRAALEAKLHGPAGLDYFVFPRGTYSNIPSFAIGRGAWDNWIVYRARSLKVPVIDATRVITAIHQNHDYSPSLQKTTVLGRRFDYSSPEAKWNAKMLGGDEYIFTVDNANWIFTAHGIKRALSMRHIFFHITSIPALIPPLHSLWPLMRSLIKLVVAIKTRFRW